MTGRYIVILVVVVIVIIIVSLWFIRQQGAFGGEAPGAGTENLYKGPIPEGFELSRDQDPLPEGALLKFQFISRGPDASRNYRWVLYDDGRLFLARHSGNVDIDTVPFDTELPDTPTTVLGDSTVRKVKNSLRDANFLKQPSYQLREDVEDGAWYIVTARLDDQVHEVIFDAYAPSLVTFLETIASGA